MCRRGRAGSRRTSVGFKSGPRRTGSTGHLPQTRATSSTVAVAAVVVLLLLVRVELPPETLPGPRDMSRRRGEEDEVKEEEGRALDPPLLLLPNNPRELAR